MSHTRRVALPLSVALLGAVFAAPASACTRDCDVSRQPLCLWDGTCNLRAFQPALTSVRWSPTLPTPSLRSFTRFEIEAVRLFQRMP